MRYREIIEGRSNQANPAERKKRAQKYAQGVHDSHQLELQQCLQKVGFDPDDIARMMVDPEYCP